MNYRLVVLTHGDSRTLEQTLASFHENVTPEPQEIRVFYDGQPPLPFKIGSDEWFFAPAQVGFCANTARAWKKSAKQKTGKRWANSPRREITHVFWLEHDFTLLRRVDLRKLSIVLDSHPDLAQMALMRDAVNETEKKAGGLVESRPGEFTQQVYPSEDALVGWPWLSHRSYFSTNPSLMRREFMLDNPWPAYESECEGRFGIDLIERGHSFGAWGEGDPWVTHIGTRDGFGY